MTKLWFPFLLICLLFAGSSFAEEETARTTISRLIQQDDLKTYRQLQEYGRAPLVAADFDDFPITPGLFDFSYRSPGKAFFYSLMVPGAGQLYTGSKTKAAIFIALEAVAWGGYFSYHSKGLNKQAEYNDFADRNWDPQRYSDWLYEEFGIPDDESTWVDANQTTKSFAHHLPETKTQQYYEMIGKYDQFQYGWVDNNYAESDSTSDYRNKYLLLRDNSNKAFGKAKAAAILSIANHLLSAFDGALAAKRFNRKQDTFTEFSIKGRFARYCEETIPQVTVSCKFY